jgi:predicted RNase H-related nuclease YkuK (DUF458 family)
MSKKTSSRRQRIRTDLPDRAMNLEEVKEAIRSSTQTSAVYVGSDSQRFKDGKQWKAVYVTVVVIHMSSSKGAKIFWDCKSEIDYGSRRMRLMNEVYKTVAIAQEIVDDVGDRPFQIHLDINRDPNARSNEVMAEAIGYVRGVLDIEPVLKPGPGSRQIDYPVAASAAADRLATKKAIWH